MIVREPLGSTCCPSITRPEHRTQSLTPLARVSASIKSCLFVEPRPVWPTCLLCRFAKPATGLVRPPSDPGQRLESAVSHDGNWQDLELKIPENKLLHALRTRPADRAATGCPRRSDGISQTAAADNQRQFLERPQDDQKRGTKKKRRPWDRGSDRRSFSVSLPACCGESWVSRIIFERLYWAGIKCAYPARTTPDLDRWGRNG